MRKRPKQRPFSRRGAASSLAAIVACAGLAVPCARGAIITWDGSIGDWDDDARWGGAEPTSIDDVFINAGMVSVTGAGEVANTTTVNGATLHVNGGALTATADVPGDTLMLNNATLLVDNSGFLFSRNASIGETQSSSATLSGSNSQWDLSLRLAVGGDADSANFGSAGSTSTLDVNGGAVLQTDDLVIGNHTGSDGSAITLAGMGTEVRVTDWLQLGGYSTTTIDVTSGVDLDVTKEIRIGEFAVAGTTSTMTIADGGTTVDALVAFRVGEESIGHLEINSGAAVSSMDMYVGDQLGSGGSTATIDGAGSQLILNQFLDVGRGDRGEMTISDGGYVELGVGGSVGLEDVAVVGGPDRMTVSGPGSQFKINDGAFFSVGARRAGEMLIENGGVVNATNADSFRIARFDSSDGSTVTVTDPSSLLDISNINTVFRIGDERTGHLMVSAGGEVRSGVASIGTFSDVSGNSNGSSAIVTGTDSIWTVDGDLTVGNEGQATLSVIDGGRVDVAGLTYVGRESGSNGSSILIDGAGSTLSAPGTFRLGFASGVSSSLTVSDGGLLESEGGIVLGAAVGSAGANLTVTGPGSRLEAMGTGTQIMRVGNTGPGALLVEDGATFFMRDQSELRIADTQQSVSGQVTATGAGTVFDATGVPVIVGRDDFGTFDILNGAVGALGDVTIGQFDSAGGSALNVGGVGTSLTVDDVLVGEGSQSFLSVTNGGTLQTGSVDVGTTATAADSAITIIGSDSLLEVGGQLELGSSFNPNTRGELTVNGGGEARITNALDIQDNSIVQMSDRDSTIAANIFVRGPSASIDWLGGTLEQFASDFRIDDLAFSFINSGDGQGQSADSTPLILTDDPVTGRNLIVGGATVFNGSKQIRLDGGSFSTGRIEMTAPGVPIDFNSGSLSITDDDFLIGPDGPLGEQETTLSDTKSLSVSGGVYVDTFATLEVQDSGALSADTLVLLAGGVLEARDSFGGTSSINSKLIASQGSNITLSEGNLIIGSLSAPDGVYINGRVDVLGNRLILRDSNSVILDSGALVTLGDGSSEGTLDADNGLVADFGANIVGYGVVDTPDSILTPFINNGAITGDSLSQPIDLRGFVKGVGTFDNVVFNGTFSPGLSPTISVVGNTGLGDTARLLMELGGTTPGAEHDQMLVTGAFALGGTLEVALINGYEPLEGDTFVLFELADAGSITGAFADIDLPRLGGPLRWVWSDSGTLTVVPSPGGAALLLGLGAVGLRRRRN